MGVRDRNVSVTLGKAATIIRSTHDEEAGQSDPGSDVLTTDRSQQAIRSLGQGVEDLKPSYDGKRRIRWRTCSSSAVMEETGGVNASMTSPLIHP